MLKAQPLDFLQDFSVADTNIRQGYVSDVVCVRVTLRQRTGKLHFAAVLHMLRTTSQMTPLWALSKYDNV